MKLKSEPYILEVSWIQGYGPCVIVVLICMPIFDWSLYILITKSNVMLTLLVHDRRLHEGPSIHEGHLCPQPTATFV